MKTHASLCKWLIVSVFAVFAATIFSQAQPSNNCTPPAEGLVAWWQAEGNGIDSVGGNTAYAALLPGGVTFAPGEVGQAFDLSGTNAYLFVPSSPSLDVGAGPGLTMEGWIKVASVSGLHPIAEWHGNIRASTGVALWLDKTPFQNGALVGGLIDTNNGEHYVISAENLVQPNVFQHVALTYDKDSGIGTLYLNGTVVAQENLGTFEPLTSSDFWIAHRTLDVPGDWSYGATLGGLLDELSIYNRALSSNEIAAIYSAGSAGKCSGSSSGAAPTISGQPTNVTVAAGANATFTVTATGTAPLYYQWYGPTNNPVLGAITSTLTLSNVQPANAGTYFVRVTNSTGFAQSSNAVLTVTSGGSTNDCTPVPSGIVGWWKGDGNTSDSAGSNNGSVLGGSVFYAAGEVNQALHYNSDSGYVQIPAAQSLNVGLASGFTIEGWIQPSDITNQRPLVEWQYNTNNNFNGALFWTSVGAPGCLLANIVDTTNNSHVLSSSAGILTTNYQHVALTYVKSNGLATIYRNGVLVAQTNLGSFTPNTTGNLLLGERTYLGGNPQVHYIGNLDEISLYGRALSQSEIQSIFNAGANGKCNSSSGAAPFITKQPTNEVVPFGGTAMFSVTATGTQPLYYQWRQAGLPIPNATNSTLTFLVEPKEDGIATTYSVVVSNSFGTAVSSNATLTIALTRAPFILTQPTNQTVAAGSSATFTVDATGSPTLAYQWFGPTNNPIPGATGFTLTLSNVQPANAGTYFVVITNAFGFARSSNAVLSVTSGGSTNDCTPAPNGIVGWWKGDGNTSDSAGSNNGSVTGGSISYAAGEVNQAFHYTEDSGYVQIPAGPSLNVGLGSGFTIEGWIQPSDIANQRPLVEWQYNTNNDLTEAHFWISVGSPGCIYANLIDTNGNAHSVSSVAGILTTNYQHIALTYVKSNGLATIYRNGVRVAQANLGTFTPNTTGNLLLGERTYLGGNPQVHYTGNLDEMSLYGRALSQSEIQSIFNAGASGKCTESVSAPLITHQPTNQTVAAGANATFTVTATGTSPLHYQWYGPTNNLIPGAILSTLTLSNVQPANAGTYFVRVTNSTGSAQSSNAVLTVTGSSTNDCTPAPTGLVGWWPGGGFGSFVIGGNNPILVNGVGFAPGEVGEGFLFTRTNQDVLIPGNSNLDVGQGAGLTLEAWINPTAITNLYPIFEWNANDGVTYWGVHMYVFPAGVTNGPTGYLYANVQGVGDQWHQMQSADDVVTANSFQHVALTYDKASGIARLYRNGTVVAEASFGSFTPKTTGNLNIGSRPTDPANDSFTFFGVIDEPSVYNRALSSNEIAAIYNAGAEGKCPGSSGTVPMITHQPTNQTVAAGGNATFNATAIGALPLHYQWFGPASNGIPGATAPTLTLTNVQPANAGSYFVQVTNAFGFAQSSNAVLTVTGGSVTNTGPTITKQPTNQTVAAGGNATFTVSATGSPTLAYQWFGPTNNPIPGAILSTLTLSNVQPANAGSYFVVITNAFGFAQSSNAVLTVSGGGTTNDCTPAPNGIVGWWKGDGNTSDSAGSNNGSVMGGSIFYAAGEVNQAFHYNSDSGYIQIPAAPSLNVGLNSGFTIEGWIQPSDIANQRPLVEWQYNTNNNFSGALFWISVGNPGCLLANIVDTSNNSHVLTSAAGILTTNYQHVALTYVRSNGVATIYRNGVQVAQANLGSFTPNTTGNLLLGERTYLGGNPQVHYVGNLDEMSLYGRALSQSEIQSIFNAGASGKCTESVSAPLITHQPTNQTVAAGGTAVFSVAAIGTAPLYYEWYGPGDALVPGANGSTLTLSNVQPANAGSYYAFVTNSFGFTESSNAVLTVTGGTTNIGPTITKQPTNQTVAAGANATFTVTATGTAPLHYQWFGPASNGIPGAIASTLTLTNVQPANAGSYFVQITNAFGFAQSSSAVLTLSTNSAHTVINPQPVPTISMANGSQVLSWPVSADGYTLQSADNLTPPINWTNVPVTLQTNGDNIEVTLPAAGPWGYFRLYHP